VLLGAIDQSISLITLLNDLILANTPEDAPTDAQTAFHWQAFTQWQIEPSDTGKSLEQKISLTNDQGKEIFSNITPMQFQEGKRIQNMVGNFYTFPLLPDGAYQLVVEWREKDKPWNREGAYPMVITKGKTSPLTPPST